MREPTEQDKATLETLVDRCGLQNVVSALATICDEKASHVETTYCDKGTAAEWQRACASVQRCADSGPVESVSS